MTLLKERQIPMDIATIAGWLISMGAVALLIGATDQLTMFFGTPTAIVSIIFVLGGTLSGTMMRYSMGHFISSLGVVAKIFTGGNQDPQKLIDEIVDLADTSRKKGILELEKKNVSDDFLNEGIRLLIDGSKPEVAKQTMLSNMKGIIDRNSASEKVWRSMGDTSPAFGMIGTVIGLVAMMANMDDPKAIGPAMAAALLTTLWGSVFANVMFLPVADKLKFRSNDAKLNLLISIDGVMAIQSGQNPRVIASVLSAYLDPRKVTKNQTDQKSQSEN
jgi:chemotaxis protein MotA